MNQTVSEKILSKHAGSAVKAGDIAVVQVDGARATDATAPCAFKAFEAGALAGILPRIETYTFPYQIELLQACITEEVPLARRGIAYVDSEAASTQDGAEITESYLDQVRQIIDISRRYGVLDEEDELARFFLGVTEEEWRRIEANPESLTAERMARMTVSFLKSRPQELRLSGATLVSAAIREPFPCAEE